MSSYYRTKKMVLIKLNTLFESAKNKKTNIDLNGLRLQLMLNYEIGELSINKMVEALSKYHGFKVIDDVAEWE